MTFNYGKRGRNRNIFVDFEILVFFRNEYLDSENWRKNEKQRKRELRKKTEKILAMI